MNADTSAAHGFVKTFTQKDFLRPRQLAEGGQGIICKAESRTYGDICFKVFFEVATSKKEIDVLLKFSTHPNVIKLFGFYDGGLEYGNKRIGYVMEFMTGGSLDKVIYSKELYSINDINRWIVHSCRGLQYLHENEIFHRDIKPPNMLLDKYKEVLKLSDFGLAKSTNEAKSGRIATLVYMAPEYIQSNNYTKPIDIFSLGISIWEIIHRRSPFNSNEGYTVARKIIDGERPVISENTDQKLKNIIKRSWDANPDKRPTAIDLLQLLDKQYDEKLSVVAKQPQPKSRQMLPTKEEIFKRIAEADNCEEHHYFVGFCLLLQQKAVFEKSIKDLDHFFDLCLKDDRNRNRASTEHSRNQRRSIEISRTGVSPSVANDPRLAHCDPCFFGWQNDYSTSTLNFLYYCDGKKQLKNLEELISHCKFFLNKIRGLYISSSEKLEPYRLGKQWKYLFVGNERTTAEAMVTAIVPLPYSEDELNPFLLYCINFFVVNIRGFSSDCIETIWNKIEEIGEVDQIIFLMDSITAIDTLDRDWDILINSTYSKVLMLCKFNEDIKSIEGRYTQVFPYNMRCCYELNAERFKKADIRKVYELFAMAAITCSSNRMFNIPPLSSDLRKILKSTN